MKITKKFYLVFMALCLAAGVLAVMFLVRLSENPQPSAEQTYNVSDLTPQQWSNSDSSEYHIPGVENKSIHVPGFGPTGSNMDGDPVVVAVIDSSIDFTNPDLAPVAYTFTPEQQKKLGCDEHGFNATIESEDGILNNPAFETHGTHCAGIIGAAWDGKGISGIASNVRLISVQNYSENGRTSLCNAMRAFDFIDRANEAGCGISLVSCSWGSLQTNEDLDAMVRYLGEKWGIVTVFAAGNDETDLSLSSELTGSLYRNPYAIIVGATDSSGSLAPYSSYSKQIVDLAGPGSGILSTLCTDPSSCEYLADAVPESNKLYEGFEEPGQKITAELTVNGEEKLKTVGTGEITEDAHFSGKHSLKVSIDPEHAASSEDTLHKYWITLNLGDISDLNVSPGDYFGFTIGGNGGFDVLSLDYWDPVKEDYTNLLPENSTTSCFGESWTNCYVQLPELSDLKDVSFSITITADSETDAVYFDAVGIGTEKVPYGMISGTSMATPAVTGFAAVLKAAHPELSGKELADLVKATVRPVKSLEGRLKSGGVIDFQAAYSPVIDELKVSGKTVTLTGSHFGEPGSVTLRRYVAGKETPEQKADVKEWAENRIVLSLKSEFDGILQAELKNSEGALDTAVQFVSKGDQVYPEELPVEQDPGELFAFDAPGDFETTGPLTALGDRLYYLPAVTKVEMMPAHKTLKCYDISKKTWLELPDLPEWLSHVSAAACGGRIYVKGSSMTLVTEDTAAYPEEEEAEARIYAFDPEKENWEPVSAKDVLNTDTLAGDDKQMILVGSTFSDPQEDEDLELLPATIRMYDPDKGAGAEVCKLQGELVWPAVAVRDDAICTYDLYTGSVERIRHGQSEYLEGVLEKYLPQAAPNEEEDCWVNRRIGVLLPVNGGFLLAGPAAEDGSGDSFLLRDGENVFTPCSKRMSDAKVSYPAAVSVSGKIYAIGSTIFEPECKFFRSTTESSLFK